MLAVCSLTSRADTFHVTVDTTGLSGSSGYLAFDVVNGDGIYSNNTASVSAFSATPTFSGGVNTNTLGASGSLPGNLTVQDAENWNESLQGITYGNALSFDLSFTNNFGSGSPDEFSFFLLDSSMMSIASSDMSGALFTVDAVGGPSNSLTVFDSQTPGVSWTVTPASTVPEGNSLALLLGGCVPALLISIVCRVRRAGTPRTIRKSPIATPNQ